MWSTLSSILYMPQQECIIVSFHFHLLRWQERFRDLQLKRRMDNKGVTLLVENLEEKGYGKGGVSLLAESLDQGCGYKGVELLADNLEEKWSGSGGVVMLAQSVEVGGGNQA